MSSAAVASSDSAGGLPCDRHQHEAPVPWRKPSLRVCSRKMGMILFTCLLWSWLCCLIHVRSLAGDSWMNVAI